MKIDAVKAFMLTEETGSISEAARRMKKPRAMLSNWISALEDEWGVSLFDRTGYKPLLTDEGKSLLSVCRSLLASADMLERKVSNILENDEKSLTFGMDHGVEQSFIINALQELEYAHPALNMTIKTGFDDELVYGVESGEIDFVYTSLVEPDLSRFVCRQIGFCDFVAVCHRDHPLASYDYLQVTELYNQRQIWTRLHPSSDSRKIRMSDSFWQVSDYKTAIDLVMRGLGWTYCPKSFAIEKIRDGELVILSHPQAVYRWPVGLLWRADRQPGPVMQHLMDIITRSTFQS